MRRETYVRNPDLRFEPAKVYEAVKALALVEQGCVANDYGLAMNVAARLGAADFNRKHDRDDYNMLHGQIGRALNKLASGLAAELVKVVDGQDVRFYTPESYKRMQQAKAELRAKAEAERQRLDSVVSRVQALVPGATVKAGGYAGPNREREVYLLVGTVEVLVTLAEQAKIPRTAGEWVTGLTG